MTELEYGMTTIPGNPNRDVLVPTPLNLEIARVLREKKPDITEDESVFYAWAFLEGATCYDFLYEKNMNGNGFVSTDPFIYNEQKRRISINEPYFSEWIDFLMDDGEPIFCIPGDFMDKEGKLTVEIIRK